MWQKPFNLIHHIVVQPKQHIMLKKHFKGLVFLFPLACIFIFSSCNKSAGITKDLNTGLTSSYKSMTPAKVYLIMNNEILKNADIPLGEKFYVINNDVQGLKVRDGKVSVGCALKISDTKGNILLDEADLFSGNDVFNQKEAELLRCAVQTGEPMNWEEEYDIHAKFWDKYGDGNIENKVRIRAVKAP